LKTVSLNVLATDEDLDRQSSSYHSPHEIFSHWAVWRPLLRLLPLWSEMKGVGGKHGGILDGAAGLRKLTSSATVKTFL
jgi:hypothetical protein